MNNSKKHNAPGLAKKIFQRFAAEAWHDEILGDLEEQYLEDLQIKKKWRADLNFYLEVFFFLRPHIIKHKTKKTRAMLLGNHIKVSFRNLKKSKVYTLINIFGLTVGMTACLLIYLFVDYELSHDDFQDDQVYRMWINRVYPEREVNYPFAPHSFGPQLVEDFPEIIGQGRCFKPFNPSTIKVGDDSYIERNLVFADSTFLNILNFQMKYGDKQTALDDANSMVLSESTAKKLFGAEDPIGKNIDFGGVTMEVTGVAFDYPPNSHFDFDYITPMHQLPFFNQINWVGFSAMTYLKFREGVNPKDVEAKFPAFVKKYAEGPIQQRNGISYDEYVAAGNGYNYKLHHVKDIHLHSNLENEMKANGNINYIYIFGIIALFILVIACINFMNLSTARSTERGKEVGVRKVLGSRKKQLISQFLTESTLIAFFGALLAIFIVYLVLPQFNELANRPLSLSQIGNVISGGVIVGLIFIIGLLAGMYPAFFISSFAPLSVLKGKLKGSKSGARLRNGLVIAQFAISITLISATLIVFDQMNFMLNKSLGFEKENVLVIENTRDIDITPNGGLSKFLTFRDQINQLNGVSSSGYTSNMPGDIVRDFVAKIPGTDQKESMVMRLMIFDDELPKTMNIEMKEGRFFSRSFNDSLSIVLNESAVKKLGLVNPIGKKLQEIAAGNEPLEYTIVGVIKDFHFQSLHVDLKPAVIQSIEGPNQFLAKLAVKVNGNLKTTINEIESKWNQFVPGTPFKSYFLDNNIDQFYNSEKATGKIFGIFTFLAIIIACIGLLGLSAFVINQRVKEIGVRKVLGASVMQIMILLSKDFAKLIVFAAIISIPVSYYWMQQWLDNFAYVTDLAWYTFLIAGVLALVIGITVICFQAIKAALANPVKSLKDE